MKNVPDVKAEDVVSRRAVFALELGTGLAVVLYMGAYVVTGQAGYWYLAPNLLLAYIPLVLTFGVVWSARRLSWKKFRTWLWLGAWLAFLPNSFYIVVDLVHLTQSSYGLDPLFGQLMFGLFASLGLLAGFASVRALHKEIEKVWPRDAAYMMVELILLFSSVGIYLGRTLRLNSWDVVTRPAVVVKDLVGVALHPQGLPALTIGTFFVLLSVIYAAAWWPLQPGHGSKSPN